MNNLTLRDPSIYGFSEDNTPRPVEPATIATSFLSGDHEFQPFAEPPDVEAANHSAAFLTGNHFNAQVNLSVQVEGNQNIAFLQGRHFLALPSTTSLQDQGASQTAVFLSGDHFLALIIDEQFAEGTIQQDDGTATAEFLSGEHREIRLADEADEDFATMGAAFVSGSYDMVNPGSGLADDEAIIRFTAPDNATSLTVTYGTTDFVAEAHFDQPFVDKPQITYTITSDIGSTITTNVPFLGGAVDQLYALIFTLTLPDDTVIPGGLNRGGVTGDDADKGSVTCEFFSGEHFERLIDGGTSSESGTIAATFVSGLHLAVRIDADFGDSGTMTSEFVSGLHEEIILVVEEDAEEGTITATFLTGVHEYPGGAHPFADSAATVDTTAFKADNGKMSADDNLASPSVDNTLYTMDEEY